MHKNFFLVKYLYKNFHIFFTFYAHALGKSCRGASLMSAYTASGVMRESGEARRSSMHVYLGDIRCPSTLCNISQQVPTARWALPVIPNNNTLYVWAIGRDNGVRYASLEMSSRAEKKTVGNSTAPRSFAVMKIASKTIMRSF